ncbi:MAG: prepilin-type N-terminal cleavage/methylation domain-containing protein [Candidatus Thiodiazotropha sp.]
MVITEQMRGLDSRQAGFTLLEILIALLILATIVTSAISMLFINLKGWDQLAAHSDRQVAKQRIMTRVNNTIAQIQPISWTNPKGRQLAFIGEANLLQFIAPAPQPYAPGGLFEYRLSVEQDSVEGTRLVLMYRPYQPQERAFVLPDHGSQRVLLSGLDDMRFQYYGVQQGSRNPAWSELWLESARDYPELIEIQSSGANGARDVRYIALRQWHTGS